MITHSPATAQPARGAEREMIRVQRNGADASAPALFLCLCLWRSRGGARRGDDADAHPRDMGRCLPLLEANYVSAQNVTDGYVFRLK